MRILHTSDWHVGLISHLCEGFTPDSVNLVVAHLMVAGGVLGGGEREAHTVFDYCVSSVAFPAGAHYVALGHLHRAQRIPAACPVRYCGSPLQLDFGEADEDKFVLLVDAAPGAPAQVRPVRLKAGRRLRTLTGTLEELEGHAGAVGEDHLRVVVRGRARVGLADDVRALFPDAVEVAVQTPERDGGGTERPQRLGRSPHELFGEYLTEQGAHDDRVRGLFAELLDEAYATGHA
ncbi:MAG: metallophosphoesterase family protein [Egibacteraceae bacterium]